MVAKVLITIVLFLLAVNAFWDDALGLGGVNPFGVLLLFLAVLNWFAWGALREGYSYARKPGRDGANLPLLARFGPAFIRGITKIWEIPPIRVRQIRMK